MRETASPGMTNRTGNQRNPNDLLRRQRLQRGWTQDDVADRLYQLCLKDGQRRKRGDINANMISRWECGKVPPSVFWQAKLLQLYGVQAEELGFLEPLPPYQETLPVEASSSLPSRETQEGMVIVSASELARAVQVLCEAKTSRSEQQTEAWLTLGVDHLMHLFDEGWSTEDILTALQTVLQGAQAMSKINRRHLLQLGAAAAVSGIVIPTSRHVSAEDRVHLCEALGRSIAAGWNLFHTASNAQVLAVGQAQLFLIQQNHFLLPSSERSKLYSSVYNLIGITSQHQGKYKRALQAHTSSYIAALESGDHLCVAQSLICQSSNYQVLGQYGQAIETIEEALRIVGATDEEHRRLRAHLLGCWADIAIDIEKGKGNTALKKLEESRPYLDHLSPREDFDLTSWLQLAGKEAFVRGDYVAAGKYLDDAFAELQSNWIVRQVLTLFPKMALYAHQGDKQGSFATATKIAHTLRVLNAPRMDGIFRESVSGLLNAFPDDSEVRDFVSGTLCQLSTATN